MIPGVGFVLYQSVVLGDVEQAGLALGVFSLFMYNLQIFHSASSSSISNKRKSE
jgi:hypothetical protein